METCRCLEYKEAVEKFNFFLPETMHYLEEREPEPPGKCVQWVPNRITYTDSRLTKPILIEKSELKATATTAKAITPEIGTKWIPVLPGLISQRLVNQNRKMKMLLL